MSKTSCGVGPGLPNAWSRPLYMRYVAISEPKNKQSEARNSHMNSLRLSMPVLV
ncbi:MAG: hypothetical protein U0531_04720 [Dehalococcoidia bacterium]